MFLKNINFKETSQHAYLKSFDDDRSNEYSFVDIDFYLRRRSLFYTFNFILPSIFITILSISGFVLPPGCDEKVGLRKTKGIYFFVLFKILFEKFYFFSLSLKEITNLLGIVVFLQVVSSKVPPSSMGVPKICNYNYKYKWTVKTLVSE